MLKPKPTSTHPTHPTQAPAAPTDPTCLDPEDWPRFRALAHDMLDLAINQAEGVRNRGVWTPVPDEVRDALNAPLPRHGEDEQLVCEEIANSILPYPTGNNHPRFFGSVHGAGTPMGIVAEMMAAAMNANVSGREHGAIFVERQVIEWCRNLFDFPVGAGGLLVTGASMANIVALSVARHRASGGTAGSEGLDQGAHPLVGYTSTEAHNSVAKAFELLGLGNSNLRPIPVDDTFRMDTAALARAIAADREAGRQPFCIVATAGTVNTGAIDDLNAIADIAAREKLWFHVDGAFGALGVMHEFLKSCLAGIERADSIAFDFHKWMHVPYDAGCVLVRDGRLHRDTFSRLADHLPPTSSGLAGGEPEFCEFGPENSRGFRALKVWTTFRTYGTERLGQSMWANCCLADYLAARASMNEQLEVMAPVSLAIVCLRFCDPRIPPDSLDEINAAIVQQLQDSGIAAPSTTKLNGELVIRINITNHRTTADDIDMLIDAVVAQGERQAKVRSAA
ncbi:MAG: pyridoxal phosphate-dependent decarboxylase family protein [Alphaproteobacteria bacterium]